MTTNTPQQTRTLAVDVWSDIMCPFCYLGDTILTQALNDFDHRDAVTIRYHSYQLMPELSADHPVDMTEILAGKRGVSRAQAEAMNAGIAERGRAFGLDYRFDKVQTINTRTGHRLIQHAATTGHQHEIVQRLFRAYFTEGLNIADHHVLADLAAETGIDRHDALAALTSDELDHKIDADIAQAATLGITGVPFFVLDNRYGVSGAQPIDAFRQALDQAWNTPA